MGNYRFKLSDMIPNGWFYKLRDMGKKPPRKQNPSPHHIRKRNEQSSKPSATQQPRRQAHQFNPRKSYYFTRELHTSDTNFTQQQQQQPQARKPSSSSSSTSSSKQRPKRRSARAETESPEPEFRTDRVLPTDSSSFDQEETVIPSSNSNISRCGCRVHHPSSAAANDIIIDVDSNSIARKGPLKVRIAAASVKEQGNTPVRRRRLRINSPRAGTARRVQAHGGGRRSLSDSFAVVKSSLNPQRDFRESMVEMIVQNNIRTSKDLEDLLACYLSLNSDEYHGLIIKVFKQIWLDLTDIT